MLPSNIEQFISDLLSIGSLQLYHTRKKHLIMKENTLFFFKEICLSEIRKSDFQRKENRLIWKSRLCSLAASRLWVPTPLDILLVPQNQLICPHCLFSIRPSSPRFPVSKHHHHDLTAATFRTSSLTCFSFACLCNPSVACPFISSILTSHINPPTSLLPLAIFSAPATDLIPGQLLAKPLKESLTIQRPLRHYWKFYLHNAELIWWKEDEVQAALSGIKTALPAWPLLTLISSPSLHTYLLLPSSSSLTPKGARLSLPSGLNLSAPFLQEAFLDFTLPPSGLPGDCAPVVPRHLAFPSHHAELKWSVYASVATADAKLPAPQRQTPHAVHRFNSRPESNAHFVEFREHAFRFDPLNLSQC